MKSFLFSSVCFFAAVVFSQPIADQSQDRDSNVHNSTSEFTYYPNGSPSYANSNTRGMSTTTYGPKYSDESHLLGELSTTTWGSWDPSATATATDTDDPYGQYAWSKLWENAGIENFTFTQLYSTTVEPTSIPTESLILPPKDPFYFENNLTFPEEFIFGVAGSAAQIEGAICDEGRSPSVQEKLLPPNKPQDFVTNENYYLYKQDIARLAAIGAKVYSFTIPWSRILPFALPGTPVNKQAIDHYEDLINTCLEYGLTPMVTLTHFDTPLIFNGGKNVSGDYVLNNYAGYANETFVEAFVNYGKIVLAHYAEKVPLWVGFNEPFLYSGYPVSIKHVVQATARLHEFYHEELKGSGKFGIKFNDNFGVPRNTSNPSDVKAAQRFQEFQLGSFSNPLFLGKDYPESWKNTFANDSDILFTADELKQVANHSDFFGIDPYTYTIVTEPEGGIETCQANVSHELWPICVNESQTRLDGWKIGYRSQSYVYITPEHLREFLNYIWLTFKTPVFVTEFGFPEWREGEKELGDQLYDIDRSIYYRSFMDAILKAIHYDYVKVLGALAWSFADSWEFGDYE